jgi:hypothetical protein
MVDINLMGDEEYREERQPEESLAQTVNLDLGEDPAEEEKAGAFPHETMPGGAYSREPMASAYSRPPAMSAPSGSSRNKAYLLVAALILAALVAVYLMIPGSADKPQPESGEFTGIDTTAAGVGTGLETPIDTGFAAGTETPPESGNPATTTSAPTPAEQPEQPPAVTESTERAPSTFPMASGMFASTRIGGYTVGALGQAFGSTAFSLISFSGNNNSFLVQFPASSSTTVTEITEAMKRNASPEDIRTVSKPSGGEGNGLSNVVVLGRVGERAGMMGPQGQQRMSLTAFTAWLKKLGSDLGLASKSFDTSQSYAAGGATRTPVQANFSGDKAGVFEFLKRLADAGPNIVMSKIIVSPSDRRGQSNERLDVVLLFDFVE